MHRQPGVWFFVGFFLVSGKKLKNVKEKMIS